LKYYLTIVALKTHTPTCFREAEQTTKPNGQIPRIYPNIPINNFKNDANKPPFRKGET
jgi:hypothetical protein